MTQLYDTTVNKTKTHHNQKTQQPASLYTCILDLSEHNTIKRHNSLPQSNHSFWIH